MNSFSPVWRVDLHLQPSRWFLLLTLALHLAALLAVLGSGMPAPGKAGLAALLALSAWASWRQESARAGLIVREQPQGWWLATAHRQGEARLRSRQVWRYLVVMDFEGHDAHGRWRQRVAVLPDSVPADTFRRLQVRLRYGVARQLGGH